MARRTNKCWAPPTWRSSTRPIHTTRTLRDTITVTTTLKCARRAGPRHMPQNRAQLGILRSWGMRRTVPRRQMLPISATRTPESSLIDQCCRAAMLTSPCCDTTCQQPWFRNVLAYNENAPYCFQSAPKHTQCCTTWPIIYACKTTTNVDAVRCKWATAKGRQHWLGTTQHKADRSRVSEDLCARKPPTQGTPCNNCVTTPATRVLFPNIKRRQEPRFIKLSSVGGKDALYRALSKKGRFAAACSRNPSPHWKTNGKSTPTKPAADANFNCKLAAQRHRLLYVYTAPCADPPTRPGPRRSLRPRYEATDPAPRSNCQGRCCRRRRPTNALRNIHRAAWQGAARN